MTKESGTAEEKFWRRTSRSTPTECWEWTGSRLPSGYGMFWPFGQAGGKWYAHRFSVVVDGREIPDGMQIDHLCKNTGCVNPAHLEVVHPRGNIRRRLGGWSEADGSNWVCQRGHSGAVKQKDTKRNGVVYYCSICTNLEKRLRRAENKKLGREEGWTKQVTTPAAS